MEKKNMVLLTVIAVATLLVAVVGATFAYFTATITPSGTSTQTTVNTTSLANVTFDKGAAVTGADWCPGKYIEKTFSVAASAGDIAPKVQLGFANTTTTFTTDNLKWELYEADTAAALPTVTEGSCSYTAGTEGAELGGQQYKATGSIDKKSLTPVATGTFNTTVTDLDYVSEPAATKTKFYKLVVYLADTGVAQNTDQGKTASLEITANIIP